MVLRKGPKGEFYGCSAFPKCRNITSAKSTQVVLFILPFDAFLQSPSSYGRSYPLLG
ncbi:topoisomerase DNA-binding C4 zinc finger domain-containing protein [Paenibacillus sp. Soil522]|uniref:topoisomerase DNA-binding C4 zinc finger domain-containing protein n=1 Tax=Paenibacillus sp. Soil522 TaxID=1736388 RepID=UPI001F3B56DE|nr:topoisomerase DNA-binding C4 zinc finger domain-containing protein [Paenibacillus sp. Soil522]